MMKSSRKYPPIELIVICLIISACNQNNPKIFCYEVSFVGEESPINYQLRKIFLEGNIRHDSIFNYEKNSNKFSQYVNVYEINNFGLNKLMENYKDTLMLPFFSIATKECIKFSYNDPTLDPIHETEYCYLGVEDIKIDNRLYKKVHKFKETEVNSGLTSWVYFDSNFIMIKQTYLSEFEPNIEIKISNSCLF